MPYIYIYIWITHDMPGLERSDPRPHRGNVGLSVTNAPFLPYSTGEPTYCRAIAVDVSFIIGLLKRIIEP